MILVDTSAWVEYDRGVDSAVGRRLQELIASTDRARPCWRRTGTLPRLADVAGVELDPSSLRVEE